MKGVCAMTKKMQEQEKYIDIISHVDELFKTMCGMTTIGEREVKKFYDDFSIEACRNSTAIEGNTFTTDEVCLLLREGVRSNNRSHKEHNEILGYAKGYWYVYESSKSRTLISEEFIKAVHKHTVFDESFAGEYRNIDVVVGSMMTDKVDYAPPSFKLVPNAMKRYVEMVNNDLQGFPDVQNSISIDWAKLFHMLAAHHIEFERIHPFQDGNGRTGRLLLMYEMILIGLLPVDIRYAERNRYYAGLKNYDSKIKYSTRPESKTEGMAKLLSECELCSIKRWMER